MEINYYDNYDNYDNELIIKFIDKINCNKRYSDIEITYSNNEDEFCINFMYLGYRINIVLINNEKQYFEISSDIRNDMKDPTYKEAYSGMNAEMFNYVLNNLYYLIHVFIIVESKFIPINQQRLKFVENRFIHFMKNNFKSYGKSYNRSYDGEYESNNNLEIIYDFNKLKNMNIEHLISNKIKITSKMLNHSYTLSLSYKYGFIIIIETEYLNNKIEHPNILYIKYNNINLFFKNILKIDYYLTIINSSVYNLDLVWPVNYLFNEKIIKELRLEYED